MFSSWLHLNLSLNSSQGARRTFLGSVDRLDFEVADDLVWDVGVEERNAAVRF